MESCNTCNIEDKLLYCCTNHPITEEKKDILINGSIHKACPSLNGNGLCNIYENRPDICREFDCKTYLNDFISKA